MGNNVSTSIIPPPLSLNDCVVDGELDIARYFIYKRIYRRKMIQSDALNTIILSYVVNDGITLSIKYDLLPTRMSAVIAVLPSKDLCLCFTY